MINQQFRELLAEISEGATILDNPSFDNSIKGISENGQLIYSYEDMIIELALEDKMTIDEAVEFIDYNTIRAIPYMPNPPIIMYNIGECI